MECNNKTSQYCGGKIKSCPLSGIGGNKCTVHTSQSNVQHKVSPAQKQVGWFLQFSDATASPVPTSLCPWGQNIHNSKFRETQSKYQSCCLQICREQYFLIS